MPSSDLLGWNEDRAGGDHNELSTLKSFNMLGRSEVLR